MMRAWIAGVLLAAAAGPALGAEFKLLSTDVKSGSPMSIAQADTNCGGNNISPALSWSGEPAGAQSFAVTIYDPDARNGAGWWHWAVFNIPAGVHGLAAGAGSPGSKELPAGAAQGRNDLGVSAYNGPCPPAGDHAHHYEITVYALRLARLPLNEAASDAEIGRALQANALATAKIVGRYAR